MLLLLLIILIIITGLIIIIPMILIINTLLFEYGMALSCDCLWLFPTSQMRSAHQQRQTGQWTGHSGPPFLPRGTCSAWAGVFSWWAPPAPHPPKRGNTVQTRERCSIFATEVTVLFVQHGFWNLSDFSENQNPALVTSLLTYNGTFLILKIELKILIFKWMSSIPQGKHICTVQNQKTTLRKKT